MEKKFKILPPIMPNFVRFEQPVGKEATGVDVKDFTRQEAEEYGELMKQTFIKHWEKSQKNK